MKRATAGAGAVLVAGAAAVGVVAWIGDGSQDRPPAPAASPAWHVVTSTIELGDQPYAVDERGGSAWVSGGRGHLLEVAGDEVVARHPHPTGPLGITATAEAVWTTSPGGDEHPDEKVIAFDRETGDVVRTVDVPGHSPYGIDHSRDAIFVALYDGELLRVDYHGGAAARVPLGEGLTQVLAARGSVWVSQPGGGAVWRVGIDRVGRMRARRIPLGDSVPRSCPQGSDAIRRSVLVADPCSGRVWVIRPRDGDVVGALRDVGRRPVDVAAAGGLIYVVSMRDDQVTVLDATTRAVLARATAGPGAIGVAAGGGAAWVTNGDDYTLTKIEVRRPPASS